MGKADSKASTAGARMPDLDGLRALAISLVLSEHFLSYSFPAALVRTATSFGWIGVDLFFVISGFLIGGILLDQREASNYYRVFYARRFFRIIPLYAILITPLVLVITLGLQSHFKGHGLGNVSGPILLLYFCFMQNLGGGFVFFTPGYLGATWSLAIEEQFYLLLPPLIRHLKPRHFFHLTIAAIVAAPLVRAGLFLVMAPSTAGGACHMLLPCRWDSLMMGVLAAYALREPRLCQWLAARLAQLRIAWLALAAGVGVMAFSLSEPYPPFFSIGGYSWIAAFFACTLVLARLNRQGSFHHCLSLPALKPIATISYGLYLLQGPFLALRESALQRSGCPLISWTAIGINLLALGATFLAAAISWRWFESRLLRLGQRYVYQKSPGKPAAVQTPLDANGQDEDRQSDAGKMLKAALD